MNFKESWLYLAVIIIAITVCVLNLAITKYNVTVKLTEEQYEAIDSITKKEFRTIEGTLLILIDEFIKNKEMEDK